MGGKVCPEGAFMRKKSKKAADFVSGLHDFIISDSQFRKRTSGKSEVQIQTEIRPLSG